MLTSYIKITLRSLRRHPTYAFINIVGLALGLACFLLIALYVRYEQSYDTALPQADQIYRVIQKTPDGGLAWTGGALAERLEGQFSEIDEITRIHRTKEILTPRTTGTGVNRAFEEPYFLYADASFFDVFGFPFVAGDPRGALANPHSVVLTTTTAHKYFGETDPIGQTLTLDNQQDLTVTGVIGDPPANMHFSFDMVATMATLKASYGLGDRDFGSFWWPYLWTYVRLADAAQAAPVNAALPDFIAQHREAAEASQYLPQLQPIQAIHLHSDYSGEFAANSNPTIIYAFSAIALFILLLACINFMNLATARSAERAREVGVRKTVGAYKAQLVGQFLGESVLLAFFALILAVAMLQLALPSFNALAETAIPFDSWAATPIFWLGLLGTVVLTGVLAGSYPALYLSRFRPAIVLKAHARVAGGKAWLRKGLVTFQFAVSIVLIVGTLVAYQQLHFLRNADLGFDESHIITVSTSGADERYDALKTRMSEATSVASLTGSVGRPGLSAMNNPQYERAPFTPAEQLSGDAPRMNHQWVDYNYFEVMGIPLLAGRTFAADYTTDAGTRVRRAENANGTSLDNRGFIITESAARALADSPEAALGQALRFYTYESGRTYMDYRGQVIGVVADHHATSLQQRIEPLVFSLSQMPESSVVYTGYFLIKTAPGQAQAAMADLEAVWNDLVPDRTFNGAFLDAAVDHQYRSEQRLTTIIAIFCLLALSIAALGLFSLASFTAERRTKEIGVRKVLGASVASVVALLAQDFVKLVIVAIFVATPVAYVALETWLDGFAYRISIQAGTFLLAGGLALALALVTVSVQAMRVARINPVQSLRSE